jgi:cytochrome b6-f complex iron-sulfur subunit
VKVPTSFELARLMPNSVNPKRLSRREVLWLGGSAAAVLLAASACGSSASAAGDVGVVAAGKVSDYQVGTIKQFDAGPIFVARDAGGLYAMSAVCTHQGCTVNIGSGALPCPCHGSVFDLNGNVQTGPASSPLPHYAVAVDAQGAVSVNTGNEVAASARVSV